jgi:hypothetical protein
MQIEMDLEAKFHEAFSVGKEMIVDGTLYTIMHTETIDDCTERIKMFLKKE